MTTRAHLDILDGIVPPADTAAGGGRESAGCWEILELWKWRLGRLLGTSYLEAFICGYLEAFIQPRDKDKSNSRNTGPALNQIIRQLGRPARPAVAQIALPLWWGNFMIWPLFMPKTRRIFRSNQ